MKLKGINLQGLRNANISTVLRYLHNEENCTRISIAQKTGLTQATLTKIISNLMEWGIVSECENTEVGNRLGRHPRGLTLNAEKYLVYSIRINRLYYKVHVYDIAGQCCFEHTYPIAKENSAQDVLHELCDRLETIENELPYKPMAVGLALPGPLNILEGRISLMSHFPGWDKLNVLEELKRRIDIPVFLDHDANCCALAEQWYGAHKERNNIAYVLIDSGIGAGFVFNGRLYHGMQGFAGEIGHISVNMYGPMCECGNRGCLELYCSTMVLENEYKREAADSDSFEGNFEISADEILERVRYGSDAIAIKVYKRMVRNLAMGIVSIINTISPELLVFSDRLVEDGDKTLFLSTMKASLEKHLLKEIISKLIVSTSTVSGDPVMLGASALAIDRMFKEPTLYFGGKEVAPEE